MAHLRQPKAILLVFFVTVLCLSNGLSRNRNSSMAGNFSMPTMQVPEYSTYEEDLMIKLLTNYKSYARPASSTKKPVDVDFDFKLGKLVKLDIKDQVMIANTRVTMRWIDPRLIWNATEYNDTNYVNFPSSYIWTPDILLHNTAVQDTKGKSDVYKSRVRVSKNGIVNWMSSVTIQASCSISIKWFPFDTQTCKLNFGSVSYTKTKLNLVFRKKPMAVSEMRANFYYSSGDWEMTGMTTEILDEHYECCMDPFVIARYTLNWRRLTVYWLLYLVAPCLCLSFIALFAFFLPPDSGERSGFGITTVLAMSVYLMVISDKLPEKSDQSPLIGVLYVVLFFIMVGVLLSVIITTNLTFKKTKPPAYLKRLLQPRKNAKRSRVLTPVTVISNQGGGDLFEEKVVNGEGLEMTLTNRKQSVKRCLSAATVNDEDESKFQEEWQDIAKTIDRRLFWVFLALTFIAPSIVIAIYSS